MAEEQPLADFNKLWDFSQPKETESKFRALIPAAEDANDPSYLAQLLTQIARSQGLQGQFELAHGTLDRAELLLDENTRLKSPEDCHSERYSAKNLVATGKPDPSLITAQDDSYSRNSANDHDRKLARVRCWLERGRVFNSSDRQTEALPFFEKAFELAVAEKFARYAIDAAHMTAIAEADPEKQIEWNLRGIEMALADEAQRGWLWSLYNNIAESYALLAEYQTSLEYVRKLLAYQRERGEADAFTLKDEARFLRMIGKAEEAIAILEPLILKHENNGWVQEEMAEALHLLERNGEALPYFQRAWELLSEDAWCVRKEPGKLARLRRMASWRAPRG